MKTEIIAAILAATLVLAGILILDRARQPKEPVKTYSLPTVETLHKGNPYSF